jgi:dimethylhistidine N-methyltransferase
MSTQPSAASRSELQFAADIRAGLTARQKWIPSSYLYDAVGSALFEAITLLPEYGVTRADARVIERCAPELRSKIPRLRCIAELGSGSGTKTRRILEQFPTLDYYPIDVSSAALERCSKELSAVARVHTVEAPYIAGLQRVSLRRTAEGPLLVLFLGSSIGNFASAEAVEFLIGVRNTLRRGDYLLLGADLVKPESELISAYDDPCGVTAAFNLNLLARVNRELGGDFNLRAFRHEARWNAGTRAIEMHLRATEDQVVTVADAGCTAFLRKDETIWTESSHKYDLEALRGMAKAANFAHVAHWTDAEWPFAECLWRL